MLAIRLDSPVPLGEQILLGLRSLIARGELRPGDELPPVRQLASDLGLNLNTVARAYKELEREGLAAGVRGRGTRVTASSASSAASPEAVRQGVRAQFERGLADARLGGLSRDQVEHLFQELVGAFWPDDRESPAVVGKE